MSGVLASVGLLTGVSEALMWVLDVDCGCIFGVSWPPPVWLPPELALTSTAAEHSVQSGSSISKARRQSWADQARQHCKLDHGGSADRAVRLVSARCAAASRLLLTPDLCVHRSHGCGRSGPAVAWASGGEVVFACGNALVLLDAASQRQVRLAGVCGTHTTSARPCALLLLLQLAR